MSSNSMTSSSIDVAPVSRRGRIGRHTLTVLRVLLAIEFAGAGLMKLGGAEPMVTLFDDIGAGQGLRYVVGALELAGAVGLLIPLVAGVFLVATVIIASTRRAEIRSLATRALR